METCRIAIPLAYSGEISVEGSPVEAEIDVALTTHPCLVRIGIISKSQAPLAIATQTCMVGEEELPLIPAPPALIEAGPIPADDPRGKEQLEEMLAENKDALDTFALYAGLYGIKKVVFHIGRGDARAPFPVRAPDELDVIFFTGPVTSAERVTMKSVCGMKLSANGKGLPVLMPHCPLRGGVVIEEENVLMQYIDNTIYTLFHPSTLTERGGVYASSCFLQLLLDIVVLWYEHKTGYEDLDTELRPVILPINGEGVASELARAEAKIRKDCTREMDDTQERIRRHEKELLKLRRELIVLQRQIATPLLFSSMALTFDEAKRNELLEQIHRLKEHYLVERLEIVSGVGIHLSTRELVITHESVQYRIGTFAALFHYDGNLDVWPIVTHHPDGVPHPHIERETGMCFGNVSNIINRALAEFRFGDAIEFFLLSLDEGYAHENVVFHPVTEWPVVTSVEA